MRAKPKKKVAKRKSPAKKKPTKKRAPKKKTVMVKRKLVPQPDTTDVAQVMSQVIVGGDLKSLPAKERVAYYTRLCQSLGLNPLSNPFGYIVMDNKMVLYAQKGAAEQLRNIHNISITRVEYDHDVDSFRVIAYAEQTNNRRDQATGVVAKTDKYGKPLVGPRLANAEMTAETKAKRRVTLSMVGLGMVDQSELESMNVQFVDVSPAGEIKSISKPPSVQLPPGTVSKMSEMPEEVKPSVNRLMKSGYTKVEVTQMAIKHDFNWVAIEEEAKSLLETHDAMVASKGVAS